MRCPTCPVHHSGLSVRGPLPLQPLHCVAPHCRVFAPPPLDTKQPRRGRDAGTHAQYYEKHHHEHWQTIVITTILCVGSFRARTGCTRRVRRFRSYRRVPAQSDGLDAVGRGRAEGRAEGRSRGRARGRGLVGARAQRVVHTGLDLTVGALLAAAVRLGRPLVRNPLAHTALPFGCALSLVRCSLELAGGAVRTHAVGRGRVRLGDVLTRAARLDLATHRIVAGLAGSDRILVRRAQPAGGAHAVARQRRGC